MPHIHNQKGQHDSTISAYIIRTDFPEPKIVMHIHKKLGKILPFGGHIELNEDPWQALEHEILEESGYEMDQLKVLQPKIRIKKLSDVKLHPVPFVVNTHSVDYGDNLHYHSDLNYALTTSSWPRSSIAENETSELLLLTRTEVQNLGHDKMYPNTKEIITYIFDEFLMNSEAVLSTEYVNMDKYNEN